MCCMCVLCSESLQPLLCLFCPLPSFAHVCGQALERQKEYFDCIRKERDELRDELADIKGKAKTAEVGLLQRLTFTGIERFNKMAPFNLCFLLENWAAKTIAI